MPPGFFTKPIAPSEEEWRRVDLETLYRFYRHPPKFFLRDRLGIRLPNDKSLLEEREPFALGGLAAYSLQEDLVARLLAEEELDGQELLALAGGQFPAGEAGRIRYCELRRKVEQFAQIVRSHLGTNPLQPRPLEVEIDDWKISGRIESFSDKGLFWFRLTRVKSLDLIRAWICHLALNHTEPTRSWLITEGATRVYNPIDPEPSRKLLADLLQIYGEGLIEPLPFFARASLAFVEQTLKPVGRGSPLEKALEVWEPNKRDERPGEKDEPYNALAFRNVVEPLDDRWQALALRIFVPLFRNSEVVES
jgi:exodeoxyribonuclease V gamma subunit